MLDDLILDTFLVLSAAGIFWFIWNYLIAPLKKGHAQRIMRLARPPVIGAVYRFPKEAALEFIVKDFSLKTGRITGDLIIHIPAEDEILSWDTNNSVYPSVNVKHPDGLRETLFFDASDTPIGLEAWSSWIDTAKVASG